VPVVDNDYQVVVNCSFEPLKHFDFEAPPKYCWFMDERDRRMPDRITSQIILDQKQDVNK
jgi:hypothetical protein